MKINKEIQERVEQNSFAVEEMVNQIVDKYTSELDRYVNKIKNVLESGEELELNDLNQIMIRLCSYAYFLSSKQELIGIRKDISESIKDEKYNQVYMNLSVGTVANKTAKAEEESKEEAIVGLIYDRAYKIMKNKYDSTVRLVDATKKIISSRISVAELGLKE